MEAAHDQCIPAFNLLKPQRTSPEVVLQNRYGKCRAIRQKTLNAARRTHNRQDLNGFARPAR